jgi:hypothetical protein
VVVFQATSRILATDTPDMGTDLSPFHRRRSIRNEMSHSLMDCSDVRLRHVHTRKGFRRSTMTFVVSPDSVRLLW